jgi:hypothetical protein
MGGFGQEEDAELLLIEYALMCQAQELIRISNIFKDPPRHAAPFISQHLKILVFGNVNFEGSSVDFSSCPVLEDLAMEYCRIHAPSILSRSLKRLRIVALCAFPLKFRISIVAPRLTSLLLDRCSGLTPSLGYMPFLVSAYVGIHYDCHDFCARNGQDCGDHECGCHAYPVDNGLLLNRLSNAVDLELIATPETVYVQLNYSFFLLLLLLLAVHSFTFLQFGLSKY